MIEEGKVVIGDVTCVCMYVGRTAKVSVDKSLYPFTSLNPNTFLNASASRINQIYTFARYLLSLPSSPSLFVPSSSIMYNISFKPPLGEAVDIISSPLSPGNQPTSILFSAHLSQGNYEKLVRDGGRVQLWSDIPRVGKVNNGAWGKMDFNEVRREVYPTELRRITLNSNAKEDAVVVVLSLLVSLPTPTPASDATKKRRFSFTYRIVYGSGGITWLGQFGKNGVVIVSRGAQPDSLYGLALSQGWSVNQAQSLCVFEVKDKVKDFSINPPPVEVAKLTKRSEFKIYALGEDRCFFLFLTCQYKLYTEKLIASKPT